MGKIEQKFSSELQNLFSYIVDVLNVEYPTKKINADYMLVAILDNKKCHAYALLNSCLMSSNINELRNIYGEKLKNNSSPQFYKNKENEIQFYEEMETIFQLERHEFEEMNAPFVGSEHVFLAILNHNSDNGIVEVFKNIGVDYAFIKSKCNDRNAKNVNNESKFSKPNALTQMKGNTNAKAITTKTPFIDQYTINLNQLAKKGEIDELIGREKEIEQIVKVLARRKKNNVILVGKSGVGKTQIVYGIANLINQNRVPEILQGKELVMINITALVSGTHFRGMFEERVNGLF